VEKNVVEPIDYEKASRDFKRYLPLKLLTLTWFFLIFAVDLYAIAATWNEWWPYTVVDVHNLADVKPAIYSFAAGFLGASVFAFRGFYWAVGPQSDTNPRYRYDPNWTLWYVSRPILGALLGIFVFATLLAGVSTLGKASSDTSGVAAYFSAAFLAGFAVTDFLNWVGAAARKMFKVDDNA